MILGTKNLNLYQAYITYCVAAFLCLTSGIGLANNASFSYTAQTVVAVGDIHGAYKPFEQLLVANRLVDTELRWSAGSTHLVSLGDLLDRGPESRKVMDLLMRLQAEASSAGGKVHVLLGNHEAMNLVGDLRNVSNAEYAAFASDTLEPGVAEIDQAVARPKGFYQHRAAFSKDGHYGKWLLSLPSLIKINKTVFVHGGLSPLVGELGLVETNHRLTAALVEHLAPEAAAQPLPPILDDAGPLWYRGTAACHELIEGSILTTVLQTLGAERVVIGHTPTANRKISQRLDGRVLAIDTGMLSEVYKGQAFALELTEGRVSVLDAQGRRVDRVGLSSAVGKNLGGQIEMALAEQLNSAEAVPEAGVSGRYSLKDSRGQKHIAAFMPTTQKRAKAAEALWRLDRMLGLDMVPLTLAREINKRWGYLDFSQGRWITETERQSGELFRPNFCQAQNDYQLQSAFDLLTQGKLRHPDALSYRAGTWTLRLTDQHLSFPRTSRLFKLSQVPNIPELLKTRLAELSPNRLQANIGKLVGPKQLGALLKRRDKLLALIAKENP